MITTEKHQRRNQSASSDATFLEGNVCLLLVEVFFTILWRHHRPELSRKGCLAIGSSALEPPRSKRSMHPLLRWPRICSSQPKLCEPELFAVETCSWVPPESLSFRKRGKREEQGEWTLDNGKIQETAPLTSYIQTKLEFLRSFSTHVHPHPAVLGW